MNEGGEVLLHINSTESTAAKREKERRWQQVAAGLNTATDALGIGIDAGILDTVVALNVLDISTYQSSEGSLSRGTGAPYVDIAATNTSELQQRTEEAFAIADQAEKDGLPQEEMLELYEKAHAQRMEVAKLHLAERQKIMTQLEEFYKERRVPYDRQIVIQGGSWYGHTRIESQGAGLQPIASAEVKQQKLSEYQEEMRTFTAFLKEKHFSS